jgi:predicted DsbA family dithiol-disulfide isomerase
LNSVQLLSQPEVQSNTLIKPIELYIFIDPLCKQGYALQSVIRQLQLQYDQYFTYRIVLSTQLDTLNCITQRTKDCIENIDLDISHPALPSIAVKAAELQGKRAGFRYLCKLQQYALFSTNNVNSYTTLLEIAQKVKLDVKEFIQDFGSKEAARAFQCDLYITREMEVEEVPSIVFFNECIEDEGLKISGHYSFEVYEHILQELIQQPLIPNEVPTLDELFERFYTVTTEEVANIYKLDYASAERELKKRVLQQKIERITTEHYNGWKLKQFATIYE